MQEFKFGCTNSNNDPRSGRISDATTPEIIKQILRLVTDDRKLNLREIPKMVNISSERVHNILHSHLNIRNLCERWMPSVLTDQQKLERADVFNIIWTYSSVIQKSSYRSTTTHQRPRNSRNNG